MEGQNNFFFFFYGTALLRINKKKFLFLSLTTKKKKKLVILPLKIFLVLESKRTFSNYKVVCPLARYKISKKKTFIFDAAMMCKYF